MKTFGKITRKLSLLATALFLSTICEGSRPKQIYESGKDVYEDYKQTGDPTWLILFILLGLLVLGLGIWNKKRKE